MMIYPRGKCNTYEHFRLLKDVGREDTINVVAEDIQGGLNYAHNKGVVHMDVRPLYITILSEKNRFVLIDWVCARDEDADYDLLVWDQRCKHTMISSRQRMQKHNTIGFRIHAME